MSQRLVCNFSAARRIYVQKVVVENNYWAAPLINMSSTTAGLVLVAICEYV